jgi:hypothetical protein
LVLGIARASRRNSLLAYLVGQFTRRAQYQRLGLVRFWLKSVQYANGKCSRFAAARFGLCQ